ncbi:MAG TPA: hypothetical protein VG012_01995 [Acidimicrobiia bacterium]|nr:hypothetical protein [Acidimicrobiia bacterium]
MGQYKFLNQYQPQTLVIATLFCYIDAVFGLLGGVITTSAILALVTIIGLGLGGFGIANEKKWGYGVAVGAAVLQVGGLILVAGTDVLSFPLILNLIFDGALVALLIHPESRGYQRIWFK